MKKEPDYDSYTLEELREARKWIDRKKYPDRTKRLELLIEGRLKRVDNPIPVMLKGQDGKIASFKSGRGKSLLGGISGLVVGTIGSVMIFSNYPKNHSFEVLIFAIGFLVISISASAYNFYNAFSKRRFTEYDMMEPNAEIDPIDQALGYSNNSKNTDSGNEKSPRKYKGDFCPFCGAPTTETFDYCPSCGKDI